MRVTTNLIFDKNFRAINSSQGQLSDIQTQLASGKKLLRPSDDPVGASQVIRLTEEIDKITQYKRNNDLVTNALELQETSLRSINDVVNRARVLAVQSGNGILSEADKQALGAEFEQIRNQVIDLMNTQNASGEFIFSGFQASSQAFEFNPSAANANIKFVGDNGTNVMQLSDSVSIQSTTSGQTLFEDVRARLSFSLSGASGAVVEDYKIKNQGTFDRFHQANFDPLVPANNEYRFEVVSPTQIQVSNIGTGALVETLPFQSGEIATFNGVELTLQGNVGDSIQLDLNRPQKTNLAQTLHNMFVALNDPSLSPQQFSSMIDDTLVGIDNGLSKMARENSSVGARLNMAESVKGTQLDAEIANAKARSAIEDVDYAYASSAFAKQETALEAAFASFPRVANLSLFNYI